MRALALLLIATPALSHDGHGAAGPHLHGWDAPGLLMLTVLVAAILWWAYRGRK